MMAKYEAIKTANIKNPIQIRTSSLPELVHLDDPAFSVMTDFTHCQPHKISPKEPIDDALNEMKIHGVHLLFVHGQKNKIDGVIASEDILGAKPIQIIQEKRIPRPKVTVKMVMTAITDIPAFDIAAIRHAKVGNIVNTLKGSHHHYALVIDQDEGHNQYLRGLFTTSQISRQLHRGIADSIAKAQTLSELQKRHD